VMTQAVGCDESRLLYALPSQRQEIREVAEKLGVHTLLAIVQVLDQATARMRISTHTRVIAEMAVVRVCHLENLDELASLIEQLRDGNWEPSAAPPVKKNSPASSRAVSSASTDTVASPAPSAASEVSAVETNGHHAEPIAAEPAVAPRLALAISADNVEQIWKEALGHLAEDSLIADFATEVSDVAVDAAGRMVLTFPNDLLRAQCEKPAKRSHFEAALAKVTGVPVPLLFQTRRRVDAPAVAASAAPSRRQQQADVAAQPFVKKALELFDGDPHRIRYVPPAES
jgi:hypothetical protein